MALDDLRISVCVCIVQFSRFCARTYADRWSRASILLFSTFFTSFQPKMLYDLFIYVRGFWNGCVFLHLDSISWLFLALSVAVVSILNQQISIDAHWLWSDCHNNAIQTPESACVHAQKDNWFHWNVEKQMRGIYISTHRAIVTDSGERVWRVWVSA